MLWWDSEATGRTLSNLANTYVTLNDTGFVFSTYGSSTIGGAIFHYYCTKN